MSIPVFVLQPSLHHCPTFIKCQLPDIKMSCEVRSDMRTTIRLDDAILREAKARAARAGRSSTNLLRTRCALRCENRRVAQLRQQFRY